MAGSKGRQRRPAATAGSDGRQRRKEAMTGSDGRQKAVDDDDSDYNLGGDKESDEEHDNTNTYICQNDNNSLYDKKCQYTQH